MCKKKYTLGQTNIFLISHMFVVAFLFISNSLSAQYNNSETLLCNTFNRASTTLNGQWNIIIDPYEYGYLNYRLKPSDEGFFKNLKAKSETDRVEYNFDDMPTLNVPGDWNTQMPELYYYEGTVWYKRNFFYRKNQNKRRFLYFGAANYHAIVYLNGEYIGEHTGGFTAFNFEVTDKLRDGDNFIVVKVDNKRLREGVPTVNTDWWNYGGITRDVKIIEVPKTFIQDYFVQLKKGSQDEIEAWIKLNGADKDKLDVTIEIPEAKIKETVTAKNGMAQLSIKAKKLELWAPDNPKLYDVTITAGNDEVSEAIGFRSIEVKGHEIYLNGKSVFLRGICIHEEAPYRTGRCFNKADAETLLGWAKQMGCNFVRLAHYPHNEYMTRVANRMGIMVWSEIPVYWTILWKNESTLNNAKNQLQEMIIRDKNKASVIIWSMSNETPVSEQRNVFLKSLVDLTRSMDDTRLVSAALEKGYKENNNFAAIVDDPFGEYVDVLSFNEYVGWYDGLPEKCPKVSWEMKYDKPVIISEFGGGALQGYYGDKNQRWTENFQEDLYKQSVKMLKNIEQLRGTTPWILMDFRSPRRQLPKIQDGFNRKGLISDQGVKKKAFFVMQNWYNEIKQQYNK